MAAALFITGTDTGIGKTWTTCALIRSLRAAGHDAVGMKPIASGCEMTPAGLRNEDGLHLLHASDLSDDDYDLVNPIALPLPASPHIAAADAGIQVSLDPIQVAFETLKRRHDILVIEGVGGWSVPLAGPPDAWRMQSELVHRLDIPVLLVAGLRLGCINHAMLTTRAIVADGCRMIGWVGNVLEPAWTQQSAVVETLQARLEGPFHGVIDHHGAMPIAMADSILRQVNVQASPA